MWRRLNREDLVGVNPLLSDESLEKPFRWRVYAEYETIGSSDDPSQMYIQAASRSGQNEPECVHAYNPLIDTPYLFLEFARIVEHKDSDQALMDWFRRYGLLGITRQNEKYEGPENWRGVMFPQQRNDDRGGPWDTFDLISAFVYIANESLTLYEAVLSRDEKRLKRVMFSGDDPEYEEQKIRAVEGNAADSGVSLTDWLIDGALTQIWEYMMGGIYAYTYPDVTFPRNLLTQAPEGKPLLTVEHFTRSWGARNLIGAMDLQFFWLVTSAAELSRCKHCGRIISYASPLPESGTRKPRKDKEFCDSRCRQNYHYHNRTKSTNRSDESNK